MTLSQEDTFLKQCLHWRQYELSLYCHGDTFMGNTNAAACWGSSIDAAVNSVFLGCCIICLVSLLNRIFTTNTCGVKKGTKPLKIVPWLCLFEHSKTIMGDGIGQSSSQPSRVQLLQLPKFSFNEQKCCIVSKRRLILPQNVVYSSNYFFYPFFFEYPDTVQTWETSGQQFLQKSCRVVGTHPLVDEDQATGSTNP